MKRIRFPLLVLFALSIRLTLGSEAPALIDRPNADSGPTQISVGIWVADISNIDSAQQNFTAELAVVLRWQDSRLAHTGKGIVGSRLLLPCQIGPSRNGKSRRSCTRWRRAISIRVTPLNSRPRAMSSTTSCK